jgi:hypothetical protein
MALSYSRLKLHHQGLLFRTHLILSFSAMSLGYIMMYDHLQRLYGH